MWVHSNLTFGGSVLNSLRIGHQRLPHFGNHGDCFHDNCFYFLRNQKSTMSFCCTYFPPGNLFWTLNKSYTHEIGGLTWAMP